MVSRVWIGEYRPQRFVADAPCGWIDYHLGKFDGVPRRGNHLGHRAPFRFIAVQQLFGSVAMADQCQLPGQIDRVLQATVHPVTLGRGTHMRRVPR